MCALDVAAQDEAASFAEILDDQGRCRRAGRGGLFTEIFDAGVRIAKQAHQQNYD